MIDREGHPEGGTCEFCEGKGKLRKNYGIGTPLIDYYCPECNVKEDMSWSECPNCNGRGYTKKFRSRSYRGALEYYYKNDVETCYMCNGHGKIQIIPRLNVKRIIKKITAQIKKPRQVKATPAVHAPKHGPVPAPPPQRQKNTRPLKYKVRDVGEGVVEGLKYGVKVSVLAVVLISIAFAAYNYLLPALQQPEKTAGKMQEVKETVAPKVETMVKKVEQKREEIAVELELQPAPTPFEEELKGRYTGMQELDGKLRLSGGVIISVPNDLASVIFSEGDETIAEIAREKTSDCKTERCKAVRLLNWVRWKLSYDRERASAIERGLDVRWKSAKDILAMGEGVCWDQSVVLASLLHNADIDVAILGGYCKLSTVEEGDHAWVLVKIEGKDYYIDPVNENYGVVRYMKEVYDKRCTVEEVITPHMWLRRGG